MNRLSLKNKMTIDLRITLAEMKVKELKKVKHKKTQMMLLKKLNRLNRNNIGIYHSLRMTLNLESQDLNMKRLRELKMRSWSSKKKMLRHMLSHQVLCMEKVKAYSTITLRKLGYKSRLNFHMLEMAKILFLLFMLLI